MKKLFKIIAAIALPMLLSTPAMAKSNKVMFNIDTIVYSQFDSGEARTFDEDLNDQTYGLGFSYLARPSFDKKHWFGLGVDFYDDQFKNPAYQLSGIYKFRLEFDHVIDAIEFNVKAGVVNRYYRSVVNENDDTIFYSEDRETRFALTPSVGVAITKNFTTEVIYMPEDWGENITDGYEMLMVKVGLRF